MARAKSIWSYIQAQDKSKNYRFVMRIPRDAQHAFDGQEKHTKSLKTWIKAEAEAKAVDLH